MGTTSNSAEGTFRMKALIVMLGWTSSLSTDMCLPALPSIAQDLATSNSFASLVITCFFLFMALSTLISGPLSDTYGRKRVFVASLLLFAGGHALCAVASDIFALVAARCVAACGAGAMMSTSTALVKDSFEGRGRDRMLALVQAFHVIAPLCAPVAGALVLMFFSWRVTFSALALVGFAMLVVAVAEKGFKTERDNETASLLTAFLGFGLMLRNKGFTFQLLIAGCVQACFMAYLALSSYIYMIQFGLPELTYSLFFAASALLSTLGPHLYLRTTARFSLRRVYQACLAVTACAGVMIAVFGHISPAVFFACFVIVAVSNSASRPLATAVMLRQHEGNTGSLSSLINFGMYLVGMIGMAAGSLVQGGYTFALGAIIAIMGGCAAVGFAVLMRSQVRVIGMNA